MWFPGGGGVMVNNEWSLSMQTLIQKFHAVKELWKLPLNKVQFYEDPKNIHKIFRPPKIFIFLKTPKILRFIILKPKKWPWPCSCQGITKIKLFLGAWECLRRQYYREFLPTAF